MWTLIMFGSRLTSTCPDGLRESHGFGDVIFRRRNQFSWLPEFDSIAEQKNAELVDRSEFLKDKEKGFPELKIFPSAHGAARVKGEDYPLSHWR